MLIPRPNECLQMLYTMQMPEHIQSHSRIVCQVALVLADGLIAAGVHINRDLVMASALLHDITKPRSFETGENHATTGGEYLTDLGYPEVGEIVRQHVVLDRYCEDTSLSEAEIVNYADKRVLHDRIVPLNDRMEYILHRYAKTSRHQEKLRELWDQTILLEKRMFGLLTFTPDTLPLRLTNTP